MFLLTSSEIPTGSLISKIHVTNFEIFKITYFWGVCVCVVYYQMKLGKVNLRQCKKKFVNLMQIISNQAIAVE